MKEAAPFPCYLPRPWQNHLPQGKNYLARLWSKRRQILQKSREALGTMAAITAVGTAIFCSIYLFLIQLAEYGW